jgi:magnesium-transporting ATPase (P-type)
MFHLFNSRSIRGFAFNSGFFKNKAVFVVCILLLILQISITYLPFMNEAFGTVPLSLENWIYPFMIGIAVFISVEIEKTVMRWIVTIRLSKKGLPF